MVSQFGLTCFANYSHSSTSLCSGLSGLRVQRRAGRVTNTRYTFDQLADIRRSLSRPEGHHEVFDLHSGLRFTRGIPAGNAASRTRTSDHHADGNVRQGLSPFWAEFLYATGRSQSTNEAVRQLLTLDATKPNTCRDFDIRTMSARTHTCLIRPSGRPGNDKSNSLFFTTTATTLHSYPACTSNYATRKPAVLCVGKNDPVFAPAGAEGLS